MVKDVCWPFLRKGLNLYDEAVVIILLTFFLSFVP